MADSVVSSLATPIPVDSRPAVWPAGEVLRDIARGGMAGIIVGILVAGLGGRLVMRVATMLHENTVGATTEAGEVIGHISLNGTLALILFGGLGMGFVAGTIWVIVRPWMPGPGLARALLTAGAAIALGTPPLIQRTNIDFVILDHDPVVVAMLVGLVGLVGFSISLVDGALDARLPHPHPGPRPSTAAYVVITLLGLFLILPVVLAILLDQSEYDAPIRVGWALAVVGGCTLTWWVLRSRGRPEPPRALTIAGSVSLAIAVILGGVTSLPHILGAAGFSP